MQILANALPGFRDIRAPVVAGYAWLLLAWLIVQPDLSQRPADDLGGALYDLGQQIGHVGIAIGVSVAAYFLGSLSQVLSPPLRATWSRLLEWAWMSLPAGDRIGIVGPPEPPELEELTQIHDRTVATVAANFRLGFDDPRAPEVTAMARRAILEARTELTLPATLLVGKEPELFAEVDRLRAEGDLRLAVVPPFIALIVLLGAGSSVWYLGALLPVLALLDQGVRSLHSSRQLVADAKSRGLVPSQALQRFRTWAEAVEAKPDSPPPPPWRSREQNPRRELTSEERRQIEQLSTFPDEDVGTELSVLRELPTEARRALLAFADDILRYAGTDTVVGVPFPPPGIDARRGQLSALNDFELLTRAEAADSWTLSRNGIAVARLLTAPLPANPALRAELEPLT